jgi:calmodulin
MRLDMDNNGKLSFEEFAAALPSLCNLQEGEQLPDHLLKEIRMVDQDNSGDISFEEFVLWSVRTAWYEERLSSIDERQQRRLAETHNMHLMEFEKAKTLFDGADLQRTGRLDFEAFKSVLFKLMRLKNSSDFPEKKVQREWRDVDVNNNGKITFEEFVAWYASSVDGQTLLMQRRPTKEARSPSKTTEPSRPVTAEKIDMPPKPPQEPEEPDKMSMTNHTDKVEKSTDGMATLASRLEVAEALLADADVIFSDSQVAELRSVFLRWRLPFGEDIHRESLPDMVDFLGYDVPSFDELHEVVEQITVFSELGFTDFQGVMERFVKQEHRRLHSVFDQLAGSGALQPGHLRSLLSGIGLTMRRGKLREVLEQAGLDKAATFEDCVRFVAAYRHLEGFTVDEVAKLKRIFERSSQGESDDIPIPAMATALVQMFGAQAQKHVDRISKRFSNVHRRHVANVAGGNGNTLVSRIRFHDFLVSARWLRDVVQRQYRTEFGLRDRDNTGTISTGELQGALRRLGNEPLSEAINEVLQELDSERTGELDMDEFFHFMTLYNARDGFSAKELEEIVSVFTRYDVDRSNTISILEMNEILQHLGYTVPLEDVRMLLKEVDLDSNVTLDLLEFQRFMRLHRDCIIRRLRHVFTVYQQGSLEGPAARMPASRISAALVEALDCEAEEISSLVPSEAVDFETFFKLAERGRALCVSRKQRKAGFCEEEVEHIRDIFEHVAMRVGETKIEVLPLLTELGVQFRTEKDRQEILKHLHEARKMSLQASVEDMSPAGSTKLGFWEFLQLMRILRNEQVRAEESRVAKVIQELGFTLQEAEQFRDTFLSWTRRTQNLQESMGRSSEDLVNLFRRGSTATGLPAPDFYKLLRTLGLSMSQRQREMLEHQLLSIEPEAHGVLSFVGFLRMMRWLLDTDFAGINKMIIPGTT